MLSQPRVGALLLCVLLCAGLLVAFLLADGTPDTQNTPDIPDTPDEKYGGGDSYGSVCAGREKWPFNVLFRCASIS